MSRKVSTRHVENVRHANAQAKVKALNPALHSWDKLDRPVLSVLAFALIPIFFGLLLGYFAGIRKFVDNRDVHSLVRFVMNFALPCSLFTAIARSEERRVGKEC